ncbi:MAG: type II toxin-antitoxin system VapB family antitoxin [Bryobacterales bacterium]|nr:type II toxin-antitoxin system VapB family antitoxin [Bryobacterales bacterium]
MGLNIKNPETCLLARDLARLTGETMTGAITLALRKRLERERHRRCTDVLAGELHAIGQRCASFLGPGPSAEEHGDLLYDERGLPK